MSKINLDKNFLKFLEEKKVEKIKIFFYEAWCSGLKIDILFDDFEISENLEEFENIWNLRIFVEKKDKQKFENAQIIRTVKADHTWVEKVRFMFLNTNLVKDRCGCGSSFSFEKKKPKINFENLKNLKKNFGKNSSS